MRIYYCPNCYQKFETSDMNELPMQVLCPSCKINHLSENLIPLDFDKNFYQDCKYSLCHIPHLYNFLAIANVIITLVLTIMMNNPIIAFNILTSLILYTIGYTVKSIKNIEHLLIFINMNKN